MISKACRVNTHLKIQMDSNGFKWNSNGIQMEFKWRSAVFYYVFGHFHDLSTSCSADISVSQTSQNSNGFKWIQMEFKWTNAVFYYVFGRFHDLEGGPLKMMCISPRAGIVKHLKIQMNSNGFKWNSNGIQMEFKWTNAVFYYVFHYFHCLQAH
jgi:hypothetical protein